MDHFDALDALWNQSRGRWFAQIKNIIMQIYYISDGINSNAFVFGKVLGQSVEHGTVWEANTLVGPIRAF